MYLIRTTALCLLFWCSWLAAYAQQKVSLSGYVQDAGSGEELIGATIRVVEMPGTGASTNVYGFYSLTLPPGQYTLEYNYVGYRKEQRELSLSEDQKLNVKLQPADLQLEEVVVSSQRMDANVADVNMSRENLSIEQVKKLPALFGEVDVIKTIQLLPGVQSAGEGTTGLFVRGGSSDQNLILLDEATVYNASHFLGFFSVFNPDAIKNVELYKGGIPARFGGRLSSIIDIQMRDGNRQNHALSGGIGTISSRLTAEGPLQRDRSSYLISGRRTYADLFLRLSPDEDINSNTLYFYDFNAKANYIFNDNNRLYLSGYFGRDVFGVDDLFGLDWGNATATARWNHVFNEKLFLNTSLIYSTFDYGFDADDGVNSFIWKSILKEYNLKADFSWFLNPENTITFGSNTQYHYFGPPKITFRGESDIQDIELFDRFALEQAFYLGNEQKLSERLSLEYGLRYSLFQNLGPSRVYEYAPGLPRRNETIIDTLHYEPFEKIQFYDGLEPRLGARFLLDQNSSVKASYNRMYQYMQIASNATAGLPIDRWIPADRYVRPLIGDQVAAGYFRNFDEDAYEASVEVYYKWMQRLIDFKPAAQILLTNNIETEILEGRGWSYGAEWLLRKNTGSTTGWLSYTLSRTMRQVPGINNDQPYPARYDRIHDLSLVLSHELTPRLSLSGNFVYSTGMAVSFPTGRTVIAGQSIPVYDDNRRNANRMPPYHRLDLSATLNGRKRPGRKWQGSWVFSVYNVYARKNPFTITFQEVYNNDPTFTPESGEAVESSRPGAVKLYLFSIIPSVTYNFQFKL
jgi:hypothetical protein